MVARQKTPVENPTSRETVKDPSENTLRLFDDTIQGFKELRDTDQKYYEKRLEMVIESSRRERTMESERINAVIKVGVDAVAVANDRAIQQATLLNAQMLDNADVLRKSVETNADVLRKSVETTATTIAQQFDKMTSQQNERIAALELINSANVGKSSAAPDLQELVTQLIAAQNVAKGASGGMKDLWALIVGGILFVLAIASFIIPRI